MSLLKLYRGVVTSLSQETVLVRRFKVKVDQTPFFIERSGFDEFDEKIHQASESTQDSFRFEAGQWVDFMVPKIKFVGGFSICSTYEEFKRSAEIELAVKKSKDRMSQHVHSEYFNVGSRVALKVGGTFVYEHGSKQDVFIAGGIGVNPLIAMIRTLLLEKGVSFPVHLVYSVRSWSEVIFREEILELSSSFENFKLHIFLTGQTRGETEASIGSQLAHADLCFSERITKGFLESKLSLNPELRESSHFYICGPPAMIDALGDVLMNDLSLGPNQVKFEKWW